MGRARAIRVALAVGLALLSALAAVQPAAAARILLDCTGDCADYELYDEMGSRHGANCLYETATPHELDKITVRPPQMHGLATAPNDSKVEWRFKIRRDPPGAGTLDVIHTSSWQTSVANDQEVANAGDGFSRRTWVAPENVSGLYHVVVELRWWRSGSPRGLVRAQYEWYKAKLGGTSYSSSGDCSAHH